MEIYVFVPSLIPVLAAVFVSSAPPPPRNHTSDFTTSAVSERPAKADCSTGRRNVAPEKLTAAAQITNRNQVMGDCPISTHLRINGICQCPSEYPKWDSGFCCKHDLNGVKDCKCPKGYIFRRNTRELCHEVNVSDYTIMVNGVRMCQDENLKTKDNQNCCVVREKKLKICSCPEGKTYDYIGNKCIKSFKYNFNS